MINCISMENHWKSSAFHGLCAYWTWCVHLNKSPLPFWLLPIHFWFGVSYCVSLFRVRDMFFLFHFPKLWLGKQKNLFEWISFERKGRLFFSTLPGRMFWSIIATWGSRSGRDCSWIKPKAWRISCCRAPRSSSHPGLMDTICSPGLYPTAEAHL